MCVVYASLSIVGKSDVGLLCRRLVDSEPVLEDDLVLVADSKAFLSSRQVLIGI